MRSCLLVLLGCLTSTMVSMLVSAGSLFAREPVWVFNNGPDAKMIALGQGQLYHEAGLTKIVPTGTDLTLTLPMGADDTFPADQRPFFAVRYKYQTTLTQAGLFFTTDTLPELSDKSYSWFSVVGDNTWRTAIVDMRKFEHQNWIGTITSFRFDPTNPSDTDSICQLSRLGFFPTAAEAQTLRRCGRRRPRLLGADLLRRAAAAGAGSGRLSVRRV